MEQKEYEVGKIYPNPDGTQWTFLGYYLEMPVWKIEGNHQRENISDEIYLADHQKLLFKAPSPWKKIFLHHFKNLRLFIKRIKGRVIIFIGSSTG
jgi:hypothetical protein